MYYNFFFYTLYILIEYLLSILHLHSLTVSLRSSHIEYNMVKKSLLYLAF